MRSLVYSTNEQELEWELFELRRKASQIRYKHPPPTLPLIIILTRIPSTINRI